MAANVDTTTRNDWVAAIETRAGTTPTIVLRTGTKPASAGAARTGTLLCSITLASNWLGNPASGSASLTASASGTAAATGTVGHWYLLANDGVTVIWQDTIGTGLTLDTNTISVIGQTVNIASLTFTMGNA